MKFIEKDGKYICPECGYALANTDYVYFVLNCPKCGAKYEKENPKEISRYDDHIYSGLTLK